MRPVLLDAVCALIGLVALIAVMYTVGEPENRAPVSPTPSVAPASAKEAGTEDIDPATSAQPSTGTADSNPRGRSLRHGT